MSYQPPASPRLSVHFRQADLRIVMGHIHAGKSTEIIGLGSVGKSNFVRRLLSREVQDMYLYNAQGETAYCVFVDLDANSLLEPMPSAMDANRPSGWHGYELIASRLLLAIMENNVMGHINNPADPAHPESLYNLYHRLWPGEKANDRAHLVAFRYLEELISRIFRGTNRPIRLVLIFDEFEKWLEELPYRFFQSLRSLRDQHKDRLLYVTTARQIMPLLVSAKDYMQYEPFIELFTDTRHFLLPYTAMDAQQTFNRLSARQDYPPMPEVLREQILQITNGHAGIIRSAYAAWAPERLIGEGMTDTELITILLKLRAIQDECKTIWRSLSQQERQLLYDLVQAQHQNQYDIMIDPLYIPVLRLLVSKGLIVEGRTITFGNIRPLVFAAFLLSVITPDTTDDQGLPQFPYEPEVY